MGGNMLIQQAFNLGVRPEDLSMKEVKFHLKLCAIFHGVKRQNQSKLAGVLFDLVPALLERTLMLSIQPSQFLENVMFNLHASG